MMEYDAPIMYVFPTIRLVAIKAVTIQINTVTVILCFLIQARALANVPRTLNGEKGNECGEAVTAEDQLTLTTYRVYEN